MSTFVRYSIACPATGVPTTSTYAHRLAVRKGPLENATRFAYDDNGNLTAAERDIATGRVERRTTAFDRRGTSDEPPTPTVRFDYTAQGWQASRVPDKAGSPGVPDDDRRMAWTYFDDGQLQTRRDIGGQPAATTTTRTTCSPP